MLLDQRTDKYLYYGGRRAGIQTEKERDENRERMREYEKERYLVLWSHRGKEGREETKLTPFSLQIPFDSLNF